MATPIQDSAFLRLPPELRNEIYSYLFDSTDGSRKIDRDKIDMRPPALLQTSRQIRGEAQSIYYAEGPFSVGKPLMEKSSSSMSFWDMTDTLRLWLESLTPKARSLIRMIVLDHAMVDTAEEGASVIDRALLCLKIMAFMHMPKHVFFVELYDQCCNENECNDYHWLSFPAGRKAEILRFDIDGHERDDRRLLERKNAAWAASLQKKENVR
jgi:hypothetical protein